MSARPLPKSLRRNPHFRSLHRKGWRVYDTKRGAFARLGHRIHFTDSISQKIRDRLYADAGGLCHYCRQPMVLVPYEAMGKKPAMYAATIEHRRALGHGGTWKRFNLACACYRCNRTKADLSEDEYLGLLAAHPPEPSGRWFGQVKTKARQIHAEHQRMRRDRFACEAA